MAQIQLSEFYTIPDRQTGIDRYYPRELFAELEASIDEFMKILDEPKVEYNRNGANEDE